MSNTIAAPLSLIHILNKYSYNILNHMEVVQNIINIVVPEQFGKRLLTIYSTPCLLYTSKRGEHGFFISVMAVNNRYRV